MTPKQVKKALKTFINNVNQYFGAHYILCVNEFSYCVETDDVAISTFRLSFLPLSLLSVANFRVVQGKIFIDFFKSDI